VARLQKRHYQTIIFSGTPMRWLIIALFLLPVSAHAESVGMRGLKAVKQCIMANDSRLCHPFMTPDSYEIFDRFLSYKLMPCLPTDFSYESEHADGEETIVKATMPADNRTHYIFHLVFMGKTDVKLDLPETLHMGMGEKWREKLNLGEQLFLMMRQHMQDRLSCDAIWSLVRPGGESD
jgi:hypothetical protein